MEEQHQKELTASTTKEAKKLLNTVTKKSSLRSDEIKNYSQLKLSFKELEKNLLCYSQSVHTDKGFHVTEFMSWQSFLKKLKYKPKKLTDENILIQLKDFNKSFAKSIKFPWN